MSLLESSNLVMHVVTGVVYSRFVCRRWNGMLSTVCMSVIAGVV